MGIDLHIDELVLHGFASGDRHRIADVVQSELAQLIAAEGQGDFLKHPLALEAINGGAFKVPASAKPQQAGKQIARAIFRSLRQQSGIAPAASRTGGGRQGGGQP